MGARKSTNLWLIVNPDNSNEVLHDFGGTLMYADTLQPVAYFAGGKRYHSCAIVYKTSRGALARARKHFPDARTHVTQTLTSIEERSFNNKIYRYKGEWNESH